MPQQVVPDAHRVALYVSMGPEPQTGALIDWLLATGREVLLPILYADNDLGWGIAPGAADLVPGRLGLSEPPVDLGSDAIATADLVICPALAVARDGVRLGRGGGSYDRALARVATRYADLGRGVRLRDRRSASGRRPRPPGARRAHPKSVDPAAKIGG